MFYREALYTGCKKIEKQGFWSMNDKSYENNFWGNISDFYETKMN